MIWDFSTLAASLAPEARQRLDRLALASPLYAQTLLRFPHYCRWLEEPRNLHAEFRYRALLDEWHAFALAAGADLPDDEARVGLLRRWRRLMSLRIAYRSVNGLAVEQTTVEELTRLAEFCLRECYELALKRWIARLGQPWDEEASRPARFCVLGLGKLGGKELNFSSDIDLIFLYEGEGHCRREAGPAAAFTNTEFFSKVAETLSALLSAHTPDGFLFRVDTRLRPEGAYGPLVPSLSALENYYAVSGQTWERLALLKARPVAGDVALGDELLETLHAFRYPRHPPPSLLAEIAAMKTRVERERVGSAALARDVKSGLGGIREIEFFAQTFQLLHAGHYPFLQTHSTTRALEQLARYGLLDPGEAKFLVEAYWELRHIEHRLQMRDEAQTHALPADAAGLDAIACSLGFTETAAFQRHLDELRRRVHALYENLFAHARSDDEFEAWRIFFSSEKTPAAVAARLQRWFGDEPAAADTVRAFACGDHRHVVDRDLVVRFQHLAASLDTILPVLARPLETFSRLARFAERYGTRRQFFDSGGDNPQFLRALALLFDRSSTIHELLCAHPEILEEVLRPEILRKRKGAADLARELAAGPAGAKFSDWLWLYARAEQVRYAIGELLGFLSLEELEASLSLLADAVIGQALSRIEGGDRLLIVALGKYGGGELMPGSDLDVMALAAENEAATLTPAVQALQALLARDGPLGAAYEIDLRLRPHGEAGPLVVAPAVLRAYHAAGGAAQFWEKQLLTRARVVAGPAALAEEFRALVATLLYRAPLADDDESALWAMRRRIEKERDPATPPERAFKTGPGGLLDFEFLAQTFQLRHGHAQPRLRQPNTRRLLQELAALGLVGAADAAALLANHDFLRRVELAVRRDRGEPAAVLPAAPAELRLVARWLGFADETAFWDEHIRRLRETRLLLCKLLGEVAIPTTS